MQNSFRHSLSFLFCAAALLLGGGCSPEARRAGQLESADRYFAAGEYDKAEVQYLNVLQGDPGNTQAIAQLGLLYTDQGRISRAVAYLRRAHELLPENLDVRVKLAQLHLASGNRTEARNSARQILERRPGDPEAPLILVDSITRVEEVPEIQAELRNLPAPANAGSPVRTALAMIEFRNGNLAAAEEIVGQLLAADPKFAPAHSLRGALHLAQQNVEAAKASLKQAAEVSPLRSPRRLQYAQFLVRAGDPAAGRAAMEAITKATPDYIPAWVALAELSFAENKLDESAALAERALARNPENVEARLLTGRLHLAKGEYDKATAVFTRMTEAYPLLPVTHFELARAAVTTGDAGRAITSLTQALNLAPNYADAAMLLASLHMRRGDHSAAVLLLRQLAPQRPDLPRAGMLLAEAFRAQGNFADALAIYDQIDAQFPENTQTAFPRGQVLMLQRKPEEAAAAFARAFALEPNNPAPLEQLVVIDLRQGKVQAALDRVEAVIAGNPQMAGPGHILIAKIYLDQKDYNRAEAALKKAAELTPDNPTIYYLLAGIYNQTDQIPKALASLSDVLARNPQDINAHLLKGLLQEQMQDYAAAREAYEKTLVLNPQLMQVLNNLAYIYADKLGDLDRALPLAQQARALAPTEPNVADTLGWILYQQGQYPRALGLLQEAAGQLTDSPEVQYHLGMVHYMMGDEAAARRPLQRAVQPGADYGDLDVAKRALAVLETEVTSGDPAVRTFLEGALAAQPGDPVVLSRLAALDLQTGRTAQAIEALNNALKTNPRNLSVLNQLARLHMADNELAKAMEYARTARQYAATDANTAHTLGRLAYLTGDYRWAASLLQEAARRQAPSAELLIDLAEALYSVGQVAEARTALSDALGQSRGLNVSARAADGRQLLDYINWAAEPAQAAQQTARIAATLQADPNHVPALMANGAASEHRSDANSARQAYEKALARFPDFTPAKLRLALMAAGAAGEPHPRAHDYALQARTAYPNDPEAAKALGILSHRRGEFARAVTLLRESAAGRSRDAVVFYYLGLAQAQTNDGAGARQSLERALELGLRTELAAEARKALAALE